jgi:hypothetical protein
MAKQAYVYSGTDWVPLASEVTNLSGYYTKGEIDILDAPTGLKLLTPTSIAVGSGSGSVTSTGTVSFSASSSVSLNGVFSATYDNYKIVYNVTTTNAADTLSLRMRASGTDNSGATNYRTSRIVITDVSTTSRQSTNLQQLVVNSNTHCAGSVDVFNPFPNNQTYTIAHSISGQGASEYITSGMRMVDNNSFDGFTIICAASMTGTIQVYGYKD